MAITPKHSFNKSKRNYIATKKFTDREEPRRSFRNHAAKVKEANINYENKHDVLVYYGVGGVGKSSLIKQLNTEVGEDYPKSLIFNLDFRDHINISPAHALLELVNSQKGQVKGRFTHFELAYAIYFIKRHPDVSYNEKSIPFDSELGVIADIIGNISGVGLIGSVTGVVNHAYKIFNKFGLTKDMKNELSELEDLSAADIEEKLPAFFAYDLQQIIKKNEIELCCVFIDTYEALWENSNNEAAKDLSDAWVRELISNLDSILFVICSREKLGWGKRESDWDDVLDQHLLGGLDRVNAREFLINCGLSEYEVVEKILDASEGHPYNLDLSVDTYFELKNKSIELRPEHFGANRKEILERFIKYLDRIEVETLKIMSVPNFYNYEIFKYLLERINVGFPVSAYKDFNTYSFISENNGTVTVHNLMREGIVAYIDQNTLKDVHDAMAGYYISKLNMGFQSQSYDQKKIAFKECIYHSVRLKERTAFFEWLHDMKPTIKQYQLDGEATYLRNILSDIFKMVGYENIDMQIFNVLVDMVHLTGDYEESVRLSEKVLNKTSINEIKMNKELLRLKIRSVHHKMFYLPVDELINELEQIEEELDSTNFVEEYNELLFMLGGNLGVLSGNFRASRIWLQKSIEYSEAHSLISFQCRNLRKLSDLLRINGEFDEALKCCERGITLCEEFHYDRYKLYLLCTKAEILRLVGRYDECLNIIVDAGIMSKKMGIKGWEGHVELLKAIVHHDLGKYSEAADYARNARYIYNKINQIWGQINEAIVSCKIIQHMDGFSDESAKKLEDLSSVAGIHNYRYEQGLIESLRQGNVPDQHLLFL